MDKATMEDRISQSQHPRFCVDFWHEEQQQNTTGNYVTDVVAGL